MISTSNSPYNSNTIKTKITSLSSVKKVYVGQRSTQVTSVWVIPEDKQLPSDIINDISNLLGKLFPGYQIRKEPANQQTIQISGTKNGRISLSPNGTGNFYHIYVRNPPSKPTVEDIQVKKIVNIFESIYYSAQPIRFKIKDNNYSISNYNLKTVSQIGSKGDRADCIVSTDTGNIFISLKDDKYQQWSGMSEFSSDSEVTAFVDSLKQIYEKNPNDKNEYYREIANDELVFKAIYGKNYSLTGTSSQNNVDYLIIGRDITLGFSNSITASLVYKRGQMITPRPILLRRNDFGRNDFGIPNSRLLIHPPRSAAIKI